MNADSRGLASNIPAELASRAYARARASERAHERLVTADDEFAAVLLAARAGAEWAWTTIYQRLAPVVLGYLRAQRAAEPEDLTGEVFLQAVRDLRGFAGGEREFRAWLLTIAHRRLLDDVRRRRRRPVEAASEDVLVSHSATGDVEQDAMRRLDAAFVRSLIDRLSPDQRAVLLLRIVGDLTVEQVAEAIGKRSGAVKALQRRGLAAIRRELAERA